MLIWFGVIFQLIESITKKKYKTLLFPAQELCEFIAFLLFLIIMRKKMAGLISHKHLE